MIYLDLDMSSRFCTICQHQYDDQDLLAITRCRHYFHRHCIFDWLSRSSTCPICRCAVTRTSLLEYYLPPMSATASTSTGAIPKNTERVLLSKKARKRNVDANRNLSFPPTSESNLPRNSLQIPHNIDILENPSGLQNPISENSASQNQNLPSALNNNIPSSSNITIPSNNSIPNTNPLNTIPSNLNVPPPPQISTSSTVPSNQNSSRELESRMQSQLDRINTIMVQMSERLSQLSVRERERVSKFISN